MYHCLGTDEAGYGPNLGPLVISATLWRVPDDVPEDGLYRALRKVVSSTTPAAGVKSKRLTLADSKAVYNPAIGLARLELGALAALRVCGYRASNLAELLVELASAVSDDEATLPWHAVGVPVPLVCAADDVDRAAERLAEGLTAAGIELSAVSSRVMFPQEFNAQCESLANKSNVLTCATLSLVRALADRCVDPVLTVGCDKHGGRNTYAAALQQYVVDGLVQTVCEGRSLSTYRYVAEPRRWEFAFRVEGESRLPTALASMVSKYVRELSMHAFNSFWRSHLPDLRPTAGYAVDAGRFRASIAATAERLQLPASRWWRSR